MKIHSFQLPFSVLFYTFFEPFPEKSHKGSKVRTQSLKETTKLDQRVSKWTPGVTKLSPKGPESGKNQQHVIQRTRNGAPGATLELKVPTNAKQTQKTHPNSRKNTPEGAPRSQTKKKNHMTTNSQPTKESKRDTKKQAIEQTHTHAQEPRTANTNSNSRGRVLAEGDVDPAAGSPKEPFRL